MKKRKPELTVYDVGARHVSVCPKCSTKERRARRLYESQRVRDMDVEQQVAMGLIAECDYCGKKARVEWFKVKMLAERDPSQYMMPTVQEAQVLAGNPWGIYSGEHSTWTVEFRINGEAFWTERYGYGSTPEGAASAMAQSHSETVRALELVGKADAAEFIATRVEIIGYYNNKAIATFDLPLK